MHPISYDAEYEVDRNRLTVFFRALVAIPWLIWLSLYGIAAQVVVLIAWFAMMFTKRYPDGLYSFVAGYVRLAGRVGAFTFLLTDELPSFSGKPEAGYPVRIDIAPPQPEYRRSRTFFKILLAFPQQVLLYGLGPLLGGASFVSWWRIVFTGKQSVTMHDALLAAGAYTTRATSFLLLLTEAHPRLLEVRTHMPPPGAPGMLYSGRDPELLPPAPAPQTASPQQPAEPPPT